MMANIEEPPGSEADREAGCAVLLSGGQDSTTCLHLALRTYPSSSTHALTFDYGQRHGAELGAAERVAAAAPGLQHHQVYNLHALGHAAACSLTRDEPLEGAPRREGLPSTFAPARNLVFLTTAASYALSRGILHLVLGTYQTSVYPDARRDAVDAVERAVQVGAAEPRFRIWTPLMPLAKPEIVRVARELGPACWRGLALSLSCYGGARPGCGDCDACKGRAAGFAAAGLPDPAYAR